MVEIKMKFKLKPRQFNFLNLEIPVTSEFYPKNMCIPNSEHNTFNIYKKIYRHFETLLGTYYTQ